MGTKALAEPLEPGAARRAAPNRRFRKHLEAAGEEPGAESVLSSSPSRGWVVSFAANHCYGSAADVRDGDRNWQRLLIWVLAGSLSRLLIFHEDESPLPLPLTGTIWVFCLPRERKYMFY